MLRGMLCVCVVCVETYIPHRGLGEALLTHGLLEHLELSLGHRGRCQRKSKGQGQERESKRMKKTEGGQDRQGVQGKHNIRQSQICTPYYKAIPIVFAHFTGSHAVSEQIYSGARRELVQEHFCTHEFPTHLQLSGAFSLEGLRPVPQAGATGECYV
jgi:hypothetical protein